MEEMCHLSELWDLEEIADGIRSTFRGFRNIYDSLVEVYVEKVEEVQNLRNSNRIQYIYEPRNPKSPDLTPE